MTRNNSTSIFEKMASVEAGAEYNNVTLIEDVRDIFGDEAMRMVHLNDNIEPGVPRIIHEALMKYFDIRVAVNDDKFIPALQDHFSA
jgi:hypothetical protein